MRLIYIILILTNIFLKNSICFWIFGNNELKTEQQTICNRNTNYECYCSDCLATYNPKKVNVPSFWLTVEFDICKRLKESDELRLRSKLAEWINEECAIVIRCDQLIQSNTFLDDKNVIIGGLKCGKNNLQNSFLHLAVIYDVIEGIKTDNLMNASVLGDIIRSREHLLSAIIMANINSIFVNNNPEQEPFSFDQKDFIESNKKSIPFWHLIIYAISAFLSSFIVSITLLFCLVIIYINWQINWIRIVKGKWSNLMPQRQTNNDNLLRKSELASNSSKSKNKITQSYEKLPLKDSQFKQIKK